jgi:hypothetical protein
MFHKVRILVHQPVTPRLFQDFFVEKLISEDIDVMFYDLTPIFHPKLKISGELKSASVAKFCTLKDFECRISTDDVKCTLYIPYFIYEYKVLSIYKILTKLKCKTAFMGRGMLASTTLNETYFQSAIRKFKSLLNWQFLVRSFAKIYSIELKKRGYVNSFDYIFNAGTHGHFTCGTPFEINTAQIVPFNSTDYTRYLKSLNSSYKLDKVKYAVFIDEYLPYHPDVDMLGVKTVTPDDYYSSLNHFFSKLELELGLTIVVAAHPKSNYSVNPYEGRLLIKDHTEDLIRDCEFVIDHFSSAISYAVLNYKPILLIYTNGIQNVFPNLVEYARQLSSILQLSMVNVDDNVDVDISSSLKVDREKYTKYKYDYLTAGEAESAYDEDLFLQFLKTEADI